MWMRRRATPRLAAPVKYAASSHSGSDPPPAPGSSAMNAWDEHARTLSATTERETR